jgi:uncharacterized protein YbjT (DUF2867 family)
MADKITRTVLVTGSTGHQGSTLARALLMRGHKVRAFTRFPTSEGAQRLARLNAEMAVGDFEDVPSLVRAMEGVDAVFAMGTPYEGGPRTEVEEVRDIFDAAEQVGVDHVVYSSVAAASHETFVPFFESKRQLEDDLRSRRLPYTIVAPVFFMENLWGQPTLRRGYFTWGIPGEVPLQLCALDDLAQVTAHILIDRDGFLGERIPVASDQLTGHEASMILTKAAGRDISYSTQAPEEAAADKGEAYQSMLRWFLEEGDQVDIETLRTRFPHVHLHTFGEWANEQDWSFLQPPPRAGEGAAAR